MYVSKYQVKVSWENTIKEHEQSSRLEPDVEQTSEGLLSLCNSAAQMDCNARLMCPNEKAALLQSRLTINLIVSSGVGLSGFSHRIVFFGSSVGFY